MKNFNNRTIRRYLSDSYCFLKVLWPDGIFIAKHPKRRLLNPSRSTPGSSPRGQPPTSVSSPKKVDAFELDENQLKEDERRARFVHELMIGNFTEIVVFWHHSLFRDSYYQPWICKNNPVNEMQIMHRLRSWVLLVTRAMTMCEGSL